MTIEDMNLSEPALSAAKILLAAHPNVIFTSGKRDLLSQARAMAQNLAQDRAYLRVYVDSLAKREIQAFLDDNPTHSDVASLKLGINNVLVRLPPDQVGKISKHLSGMAFDVQPIPSALGGDAVMATILKLPGLDKFLTYEGDLSRWHIQFLGEA